MPPHWVLASPPIGCSIPNFLIEGAEGHIRLPFANAARPPQCARLRGHVAPELDASLVRAAKMTRGVPHADDRSSSPVAPSNANGKVQVDHDSGIDHQRNIVGGIYWRVKDWRRVAVRVHRKSKISQRQSPSQSSHDGTNAPEAAEPMQRMIYRQQTKAMHPIT